MNNKISNSEFTIIKSAVDKFIDEYIPLNSTQAKLEEILKSYIVLALNNNSRIDKYLNKFDCDTAYYKKIKAISLIKFYNWPFEEIKYLLRDICILVWEAIELDPENANDYEIIVKNFLIQLRSSWILYGVKWLYYIQDIYHDKYWNLLISDSEFYKRFKNFQESFTSWKEYLNVDLMNEKINEILDYIKNSWNTKIPNREKINEAIQPLMNEYLEIYKDYEKQCEFVRKMDTSETDGGICIEFTKFSTIEEFKSIIAWMLEDEREDRKVYIFFKDIDESKQKEVLSELNKKFKWRILKDHSEYSASNEFWRLWELQAWLQSFYYDILEKVVDICSYHDDADEEFEVFNEYKEDSEDITRMQKQIEEMKKEHQKQEEELRENYDKKVNKIMQEHDLNNAEKDNRIQHLLDKIKVLENNWEEVNHKSNNLSREEYQITVVWWSEKANKHYEYTMFKDDAFISELKSRYWLDNIQFHLEWSYTEQKNKKFKDMIENELYNDQATFVIVLQSDHETEFHNWIKEINQDINHEFNHRVTTFWEIEKDWLSRYDQKFSKDRFFHYLDIALEKYEAHQSITNNLIR